MSKDTEQKTRKTSTVNLQGGVEYAKVSTRLVEFHEDNSSCSIETDIQFQSGGENTWVIVTATVVCPRGRFVAHSMDAFKGKQKFLEKLETVAVGRALAFAGYMASGEIASFEEIDNYYASVEREANKNAALDRIEVEFDKHADDADPQYMMSLLKRVAGMTTLDGAVREFWLAKISSRINEIKGNVQ